MNHWYEYIESVSHLFYQPSQLHIKAFFKFLSPANPETSHSPTYLTTIFKILEMSTSNEPRLVGLRNPKPHFDIERDPLDWEKLKSMKSEDKNAQIVRRANFFNQANPPPNTRSRQYFEALQKATEQKAYSMVRPAQALVMPVE
jgi:hypothetical protein